MCTQAPGEHGAVFPQGKGWAQISSPGMRVAGFREPLGQMELPAGALLADSREGW